MHLSCGSGETPRMWTVIEAHPLAANIVIRRTVRWAWVLMR